MGHMVKMADAEKTKSDLLHYYDVKKDSHGKMDNADVVSYHHVEGKIELMFLKDFEEICLKEKTSVQDINEYKDCEDEQKKDFLKQTQEYYFLRIKERILDESITNLQRNYEEMVQNGQSSLEKLADEIIDGR